MATRGLFFAQEKMTLNRLLIFALLCCVFIGSLCSAEPLATLRAADSGLIFAEDADFGISYSYQEVRVEVRLRNASGSPLRLAAIKPRLGTDRVLNAQLDLMGPGDETVVSTVVSTGSMVGRIARYFDVYVSGQEEPVGSFAIRGFVDWVIDPESTRVDFHNIDQGRGVSKTHTIKAQAGSEVKVLKPLGDSARFAVEVVDGTQIRLTSKQDAPLGLFDEYLRVSTNSRDQPIVGIRVRGQIVTRLVPSSNPVDFGLVRIGDAPEQIVRLHQVEGDSIAIGKIRSEGIEIRSRLEDCIPKSESCRNLRLKLPAQENRGQIGGVVFLELLPTKKELPIEFGVVVIGKGTQIRSFEDDLKMASEAQPPVSDVLKSAIRKPVTPFEMPRPPGSGPLLTWQATNEYGVFGYEIYRGLSKTGPFSRVTREFVKKLDVSGKMGSVYRWRDSSAKAGTTYFYYVGLVYEDGRKREFTTPQEIVAK